MLPKYLNLWSFRLLASQGEDIQEHGPLVRGWPDVSVCATAQVSVFGSLYACPVSLWGWRARPVADRTGVKVRIFGTCHLLLC